MFNDPTFWFLVSFVIFFLLVGKFLWHAIAKGLDQRARKIEDDIEEAVRMREEALALLSDIKQKHADAEQHAAKILEHAESESKRLKSEARKELDEFLKRREKLAGDRIAYAEGKAIKDIRNGAVKLAALTAERLLQKTIDSEMNKKLIQQSIEELKKPTSNKS